MDMGLGEVDLNDTNAEFSDGKSDQKSEEVSENEDEVAELQQLAEKREPKKRSNRNLRVNPGPNGRSILVRARMPDYKKLTRQVESRRRSFEIIREVDVAVFKDKKPTGMGAMMGTMELLSGNVMNGNPM